MLAASASPTTDPTGLGNSVLRKLLRCRGRCPPSCFWRTPPAPAWSAPCSPLASPGTCATASAAASTTPPATRTPRPLTPPVTDRARQPPAQQATGEHRPEEDVLAALPDAIQHGADKGRKQRERCHGDDQRQRNPAPGLSDRRAEEQRSGQADGHETVPDAGGGGQLDELGEAGSARSGRMGHLVQGAGSAICPGRPGAPRRLQRVPQPPAGLPRTPA